MNVTMKACIDFFNEFKSQNLLTQEIMLNAFTNKICHSMNRAKFHIIVTEKVLVIRFHYASIDSTKQETKDSSYHIEEFMFSNNKATLKYGNTEYYPDLKKPFPIQSIQSIFEFPTRLDMTKLSEYQGIFLDRIYNCINASKEKHNVYGIKEAHEDQGYPMIFYTDVAYKPLEKIEDKMQELIKGLKKRNLTTIDWMKIGSGWYDYDRGCSFKLGGLVRFVYELNENSSRLPDFYKEPKLFYTIVAQVIYETLMSIATYYKKKGTTDWRLVFSLLDLLRETYHLAEAVLSGQDIYRSAYPDNWKLCRNSIDKCIEMANSFVNKKGEKEITITPWSVPIPTATPVTAPSLAVSQNSHAVVQNALAQAPVPLAIAPSDEKEMFTDNLKEYLASFDNKELPSAFLKKLDLSKQQLDELTEKLCAADAKYCDVLVTFDVMDRPVMVHTKESSNRHDFNTAMKLFEKGKDAYQQPFTLRNIEPYREGVIAFEQAKSEILTLKEIIIAREMDLDDVPDNTEVGPKFPVSEVAIAPGVVDDGAVLGPDAEMQLADENNAGVVGPIPAAPVQFRFG